MLQKQPVSINFLQGLDTKTDPWQVPAGKFLALQNSVFTKGGLLQKRNGFGQLPSLANATYTYLTTLNNNLTALGPSVSSYSAAQKAWVSKGSLAPLALNTLPLIRNSVNQVQCDSAVADNGLICTVYTENNNGTNVAKYVVADSFSGLNVVAPTAIPVGSGTVQASPRVFLLGNYFVIVFTNLITATSHLQYISVSSTNPTVVTTAQDIAAAYDPASTVAWDGVVANNKLFVAYNTSAGGQSVKYTYLTPSNVALGQTPTSPSTFSTYKATIMSLCVDNTTPSNPIIYISFYDIGTTSGYTAAIYQNLAVVFNPQSIISSGTVLNLASAAQNGVCTVFSEVSNNYGYDAGIPTHYINKINVTVAGSVGSPSVCCRSVGLASKAFIWNATIYVLTAYSSTYQPTYFLLNGASTQAAPQPVMKLAYQNGVGYVTLGLPNVTVQSNVAVFPYLVKDFIAAQTTVSATPSANPVVGVYSQTGINLASVAFDTGLVASHAANNLHISGGFLWQFDGYYPVEHNFFLYPDNVEATWSASGGSMAAQPDGATNTNAYFYQVCYEWEDNQGLVYRSSPSLPIAVTTTGSGTSGSVTINVPYLRLTYKIPNPAKLVIYRWSVGQQVFHRVTSLTNVQLNSTTSDSLAYVDTLADASIAGNDILYTTGGVIEDMNAPATNIMTLFDTRLWVVDAEDQNLLWFSKQIIDATPVEMSDLLTVFVPPTTGSQGSTGPIKALAPMDDKLIIFKENAIYYINGNGPDNTGANNGYSPAIFITSTVGCANPNSIVFMPQGLMFQSNKGIWLLSRDLSTNYIGAPVEAYNQQLVESAVLVPQTNQVRMTLDNGITLMYDYFYGQWGTFNISGISSCIYNDLHTLISSAGLVYQETVGTYLDGSKPVLLSFTTSWLNMAGLQGYQRAYYFYLLGKYYSPHKLNILVSYDYNAAPAQSVIISPENYSTPYGGNGSDSQSPYGQQGFYGGPGDVEQWRIFLKQQRCQAMQITVSEVFDPSFGTTAGAGLTLSGINAIIGVKKGYRPIRAANSAGVS